MKRTGPEVGLRDAAYNSRRSAGTSVASSVPVMDTAPAVVAIVPPECVTVPALIEKLPATVSVLAETMRLGWVPAPVASV